MADLPSMLGEDPAFLEVEAQVSRLAAIDRPCLVIGERGTGKELFATRLHYLSPRWDGPLVKVNCAALTESLLDTELFGHEAGAFTGAQRQHVGRFERADGGTLLLDEIASASAAVQEKVLRVIEYGEMERVGGRRTIQLDVRVIGAANVDLPSLARYGAFRADLLDRLAFEVVTLPPLRARPVERHGARPRIRPGDHPDDGQGRIPRIQSARGEAAARTFLARKRAGAEERRRARGLSFGVIRCGDRHGRHRPFRQPVASRLPVLPAPSTGRPPANPKRPTSPDSTARTHRPVSWVRRSMETPKGALPAGPSGTGGATTDFTTEVARFERGLLSGRSTRPVTTSAKPHGRSGSDTTSSDGC